MTKIYDPFEYERVLSQINYSLKSISRGDVKRLSTVGKKSLKTARACLKKIEKELEETKAFKLH